MVKHWSLVTGECMKYGWEQITPWYRVTIEELVAKKLHDFLYSMKDVPLDQIWNQVNPIHAFISFFFQDPF